MEHECALPRLQELATCRHPEPDWSTLIDCAEGLVRTQGLCNRFVTR
jgi:hypothetical protein